MADTENKMEQLADAPRPAVVAAAAAAAADDGADEAAGAAKAAAAASAAPVAAAVAAPAPAAVAVAQSAMANVAIHTSTMVARAEINAQIEAQKLKIAMKGFGTDNKAIIEVLTTTSNPQRQLIAKEYKVLFGRELREDIHNETSGNFRKTCEALLRTPPELDAESVRTAIKGLGTDEETLIEVVCTSTNDEIKAMKEEYTKLFNRDMEKDISSDLSGNLKNLMVSLLQAGRMEIPVVNVEGAKVDAQALFDAGEGKWGTDEGVFNAILVSKSYPQLGAIFEEYKKISEHDIMEAIDKELSGDYAKAMKTIVQCVRTRDKFYALRLHKAMKGLGTDDATLIRVIVRNCDKDVGSIKLAFEQEFQAPLSEWVKDDTSGDYRRLIMIVLGDPMEK